MKTPNDGRDRIACALGFICADERKTWLEMGMAIHSELGPDGFSMWDAWSQQSESYNKAAALSVWRSFGGVGISIATLFHEARLSGWKDDQKFERPTQAQLNQIRATQAERASEVGQERARQQRQAAKKAAWIINQTKPEKHAYFDAHGMKDDLGMVWRPTDEHNILCIPMRVRQALVGVQMINREGEKKFLKGQLTTGAEYVMDNKGPDFWVEGLCTGMALRNCLKVMRERYTIHVTFSAGNLAKMAAQGYVIADNDASQTGEKTAIETGLPYFMSDRAGEDFCDMWRRLGAYKTKDLFEDWLYNAKNLV